MLKRSTKNTRCAGLIDIYSIQCFLEAPLLLSTDVIRWCFSLTFGRFEPTLGLPGITALEPRIVYCLLALELGWTGMKDCFLSNFDIDDRRLWEVKQHFLHSTVTVGKTINAFAVSLYWFLETSWITFNALKNLTFHLFKTFRKLSFPTFDDWFLRINI